MRLSSFLPVVLAAFVTAQNAFTDNHTNITYQVYSDENLLFGVALSTNTTSNDFIGLIIGTGAGYVGVSLGGAMVNSLLIAAWPNQQKLVSSFRTTDAYMSPAVANGTYKMIPISHGTYVNSTHFSYNFLCKGCLLTDGTTFTTDSGFTVLGWAYSTNAPVTPASANTNFTEHSAEGNYGLDVADAQSVDFKKWAAMAGTRW